jgi:RNA polymerase sigma factor (sigma-70 family)
MWSKGLRDGSDNCDIVYAWNTIRIGYSNSYICNDNRSEKKVREDPVQLNRNGCARLYLAVNKIETHNWTLNILGKLTPTERFVIEMRFGLRPPTPWSGNEPKTLEEVGSGLGVSRERVRQTEAKTLAKIRKMEL